ncbi:class I SAM-dependent DNA methyltransferase [Microbulbifer yueqingensis]|uniref:Methyltransferase domain-containing protein n=1 Tax=Microbulbifer yueqingensis TaxID=658219 RepID=A0A1G8V9H1_9GAMM|nr:class I SAM-dependent methyltransferase [Microbulbifer yueqingensis]SDJ61975.1 Methyltransferase domain-containing protein [Microbulbifer yueqingensis]
MTDNSWDSYAEGWDSNSDVITYSERAFRSLAETLDCKGARILDFGCGTGLLTERLAPLASSIVALDPSGKMLAVLDAKQLGNVTTIQSSLTRELVDQNRQLQEGFDLIVASSALAFVPDYTDTVRLLAKLLNRNGRLVQWDWLKEDSGEDTGFTREDIAAAFRDAGLSDIQVTVPFFMGTGENQLDVVMGTGTKQ